jgi:hypothetical protein
MRGARETVAKALALECMRAAKEQERDCYVFAFAGPAEVGLGRMRVKPQRHVYLAHGGVLVVGHGLMHATYTLLVTPASQPVHSSACNSTYCFHANLCLCQQSLCVTHQHSMASIDQRVNG